MTARPSFFGDENRALLAKERAIAEKSTCVLEITRRTLHFPDGLIETSSKTLPDRTPFRSIEAGYVARGRFNNRGFPSNSDDEKVVRRGAGFGADRDGTFEIVFGGE